MTFKKIPAPQNRGSVSVRRIETKLTLKDYLGAVGVRLGLGRNNYRIEPGLYSVGTPSPSSSVLVSANYKLSFDALRKELGGIDAWILILDTKGINVWCSAGKGSFGDEELSHRIRLTRLGLVVEHRDLILPQLAATGVSAPAIRRTTGWTVHYGPVHARDLPAYLAASGVKTEAMRRMEFPFVERLKLIPLEFVHTLPRLGLLLLLWILAAFASSAMHGLPHDSSALMAALQKALQQGGMAWLAALMAVTAGTVLVPACLPWIPFRSFVVKGLIAGFIVCTAWIAGSSAGLLEGAALALFIPSISAWMALNFTGCTTFTSLAGVQVEVRLSRLPLIAGMALGLGLQTLLLIVRSV